MIIYVEQLKPIDQNRIKKALENFGISDNDLDIAMHSKITDLDEIIDVKKFMKTLDK